MIPIFAKSMIILSSCLSSCLYSRWHGWLHLISETIFFFRYPEIHFLVIVLQFGLFSLLLLLLCWISKCLTPMLNSWTVLWTDLFPSNLDTETPTQVPQMWLHWKLGPLKSDWVKMRSWALSLIQLDWCPKKRNCGPTERNQCHMPRPRPHEDAVRRVRRKGSEEIDSDNTLAFNFYYPNWMKTSFFCLSHNSRQFVMKVWSD